MPAAEVLLSGDPQSAGVARRFVAATLTSWNAIGYDDVALLCVSELVTNAALHARTDVSVRIELNDGCLRLEVTDTSRRQPIVRHYSTEATTGRGLGLVEAVAERWGINPHTGGGKTVWAEMMADAPPTRSTESFEVDLPAFGDLYDEAVGDEPGGALAMDRPRLMERAA